ncbi:unnamed protein product [Linum tenue]|uniref:Uncharacterized protein n=1 Tax=Linum tenue TaxID=586396 RepID=A0AAV0ITS5_9ROSI|nr:unnamed protein product [Linum tenue]
MAGRRFQGRRRTNAKGHSLPEDMRGHRSQGFDVDCPPSSEYGCIYRREHYHPTDRTFDKKVERAVKFVVDTYNQQKASRSLILSGMIIVMFIFTKQWYPMNVGGPSPFIKLISSGRVTQLAEMRICYHPIPPTKKVQG